MGQNQATGKVLAHASIYRAPFGVPIFGPQPLDCLTSLAHECKQAKVRSTPLGFVNCRTTPSLVVGMGPGFGQGLNVQSTETQMQARRKPKELERTIQGQHLAPYKPPSPKPGPKPFDAVVASLVSLIHSFQGSMLHCVFNNPQVVLG